jgi:hypothetical protein
MPAVIRKLLRVVETQLIEGGKPAVVPPRLMAPATVVRDRRSLSGFEGTRP